MIKKKITKIAEKSNKRLKLVRSTTKKPAQKLISNPNPPLNFEELFEKMNTFLEKNKEKFILVAWSEEHNYFVLVHKKMPTTKRINENSVFQPVTFEEDKQFPIAFILWVTFSKQEPEFLQNMKKFSTTVIKCLPMDDFDEKINRFVVKA